MGKMEKFKSKSMSKKKKKKQGVERDRTSSRDEKSFVKAKRFAGYKAGFVFKMGNKGLGYYRDGVSGKTNDRDAVRGKKGKRKAHSSRRYEHASSSSTSSSSSSSEEDSSESESESEGEGNGAKSQVRGKRAETGVEKSQKDVRQDAKENGQYTKKSFADLGLAEVLCEACDALKWKNPSLIQAQAIPPALRGRDIIGLAETGSGKTAAFALPVLHALLLKPRVKPYAVILTPTRELAFQINEQFEALGNTIGVQTCVIVGGVDMMQQSVALARKPHVIVATPGRLVDHMENTKGFSLRQVGELILDEADRMLSMDFEEELNRILEVLPREGRRTSLFSATMTSKVEKLQRASLLNPVKVEVATKFQTVKTLLQQYLFVPSKFKECYFTYLMNEFAGQTAIVFCATHLTVQRTTLMLRNLGFSATCLHGGMTQHKRLGALTRFKAGDRNILIATDVASRGLDIPSVDLVVNFDVPESAKDYVHRVGRTARAGRSGRAVTFVTQYTVEKYQRIEKLIGKRLEAYPAEKKTVLILLERVSEAQRRAVKEIREEADARGNSRIGRSGGGGKRRPSKRQKKRR
eukprot:g5333.t1